jgi:DNA-binding beta-propeller fold protein YncE
MGHGHASLHNGYLVVILSVGDGVSRGGLAFYDISNPYAPRLVSRKEDKETEEITEAHGYGFSSSYPGDYVALQAERGIQIWDWSDVSRPVRLSYLVLPGVGKSDYALGAWWLSWQAPFIYVGGGANGIYVVDATDPVKPVLVDRGAGRPNPLPTSETGGFRIGPLFAVGNLLFASSMEGSGYVILDIADPRQPSVLSVEAAGPPLYSFLLNGNKLLGAGTDDFFYVHDVSDPRHMSFLGRVSMKGRGGYLTFQDGFAHVGASVHYAKIDLRDPKRPALVGTGSSNREGRDEDFATVLGNLTVVGDDHGFGSSLIPHQTLPDTKGPAVNMVVPADGAGRQLLSTRVGLTFTDLVDLGTVNASTFLVRPLGGAALAGKYSTEAGIVNFSPDAPLLPDRVYEVVVPAGGIRDHAGNPVETTFTSRFDTGPPSDSPISCRVVPGVPVATGQVATLAVEAEGSAGPFAYSWDFGDGSPPTPFDTRPSATHRYARPGHLVVTATAMDGVHWGRCSGIQTVHYPLTPVSPAASSTILIDEDAGLVWCVNPDHGSVSAVDRDALEVRFEQPVGRGPRTIAQAPDGTLWVVNQDDATIAVLDRTTGSRVGTVALPPASRPFGLAFAPDGGAGYVTLEATGRLAKLDPRSREVVASLDLGPWPRGIAVSADSARILVTRFISPRDHGTLYDVDAAGFTKRGGLKLGFDPGPDTEASGRGVPNYLVSATISPDGRRAWVPSKKDNTRRGLARDAQRLTFDSTVRTVVSQIDLAQNREDFPARRDLNDGDLAIGATFSALGDYVFVALQGSNRVDFLDAYSRALVTSIENAGRAPQAVALSRDGRLFVHAYLSREIIVHDVAELLSSSGTRAPRLAALPVMAEEALPAAVLAGKQLFYNAQDRRMNRDGYLSCASCHLDGGEDGRVWDFTDRGEGLRNTIALRGRRGLGHGRLHWTANFDEVQDFEHDIRGPFAGTGFLSDRDFNSGRRNRPLGDPKAGLSPELDALAAYVESLDAVPPSPHRNADGTLTAEAEAGRLAFQRFLCSTCHSGPDFTDSASGFLHDVGTLRATSGRRLGQPLEGLDTPTLKGVWQTAPHLHDGSAATLRDVLTTANPAGRHGDLRSASQAEIRDLVAYLLQIDEREPAPPPATLALRIVSPAEGTRLTEGPPVPVEVEARSDLGPVTRVELLDGDRVVAVDTVAPYVLSWRRATKGVHALTVIATHGNGTRTQSPPVRITIGGL